MSKKIILFGPPGIGKSTITRLMDGFDLETSWPEFDDVLFEQNRIIGSAGFSFDDERFNGHMKVLLTLNQDLYESRREERDASFPGKKDQANHVIEDWIEHGTWDHILESDSDIVLKLTQLLNS